VAIFAELIATTNFSFLRGASHPHEMVQQAAQLGLAAIGIADRFASSMIVLHVIPREMTTHAMYQRLGHSNLPFMFLDPLHPQRTPASPPDDAEDVIIDLREQTYTALQAFLPAQIAHHAVELRVLVGHPSSEFMKIDPSAAPGGATGQTVPSK